MRFKLFGAILGFLMAVAVVKAAVAPGENLVLNGNFEADQLDFPQFWGASSQSVVSYSPTAGPESVGAITFRNHAAQQLSGNVRQHGINLVSGETYRVTAWIKTVDFKSSFNGVIIHNHGWYSSQGILRLPENSDGWQRIERTFKAAPSSSGSYGVALLAKDFTGELAVACVKLEAISPAALAGSSISPVLKEMVRPRLVAWSPLLNKIPLDKPTLTFRAFGQFAKGENDQPLHTAHFVLDGKELLRREIVAGDITLNLAGVSGGNHTLESYVLKGGSDEPEFGMTNLITLITVPQVDTSHHRRLNNLVTEVLHQELATQDHDHLLRFSLVRSGWIFLTLKGAEAEILVDDVKLNPTARNGALELFSHQTSGEHKLTIKGAKNGAVVTVRAITEIFNYPACAHSQVPQNGKYDWNFHEQYVFPAVTTLNGGAVPDIYLPELKKRGLLWLANLGTTGPKDVEDLLTRLQKASGLTLPKYDGVTCDEQFFSDPKITFYTEALRAYNNPLERLIYTWIVGKPTIAGIHNDFISTAMNTSHGRGKMLFEAYCHARPDEQDAENYLRGRIIETMESFLHFYPEAAPSTGMILGNFNQIPVISLDVNPAVDYKYYLDMQLNILANHGLFKELGTIGYWGSYYDDEELYRWSFKLLRHYGVEGNTTMLSPKYGYKYNPGCLQNCDFTEGLTHWQVASASGGSITTTNFSGYGKVSQGRWGAAQGTGDTFCLLKRQADKPNTITQQAHGLVPGKVYTLQFVTADYQDMLQKRVQPRQHGIEVKLSAGAEVIPEKSWVYVDNRKINKESRKTAARVNLHHVRFKAVADNCTVTFSDETATAGEELALNYIMLKPYFEE